MGVRLNLCCCFLVALVAVSHTQSNGTVTGTVSTATVPGNDANNMTTASGTNPGTSPGTSQGNNTATSSTPITTTSGAGSVVPTGLLVLGAAVFVRRLL